VSFIVHFIGDIPSVITFVLRLIPTKLKLLTIKMASILDFLLNRLTVLSFDFYPMQIPPAREEHSWQKNMQ